MDNSDPYRAQAEATDIYPLYIDDIDRNSGKTISVETYGGNLHWEGSITYTNQTTRKNYCLQNYLSCDNARIAEADNEIPGIKRGQLYAELLHRRVSIVVRVIDQTMPNVLPTTGEAHSRRHRRQRYRCCEADTDRWPQREQQKQPNRLLAYPVRLRKR